MQKLVISYVTHPFPFVSEMNADSPNEEASDTLYDPSVEESETTASDDDTVALKLPLSQERAQRLRNVAQQLGLSPSMIAKRAIEMICDEVVTIHDTYRPSHLLVEEYQTRIDLLHAIENEESDAPEIAMPGGEASESDH